MIYGRGDPAGSKEEAIYRREPAGGPDAKGSRKNNLAECRLGRI